MTIAVVLVLTSLIRNDRDDGPTCESVSDLSFGHTGFTGAYAWVDPEYNLVYIFLSNRIHPTAKNTKLIKMNTRTEIHQVIYDAIIKNQKPEEMENGTGVLGIAR